MDRGIIRGCRILCCVIAMTCCPWQAVSHPLPCTKQSSIRPRGKQNPIGHVTAEHRAGASLSTPALHSRLQCRGHLRLYRKYRHLSHLRWSAPPRPSRLDWASASPSDRPLPSCRLRVKILPVVFWRRWNPPRLSALFQQGADFGLLFRLMAKEIVVSGYGESAYLRNDPIDREQYVAFRRRVLHLSSLNLARSLYVGPIVFEDALPISISPNMPSGEGLAALDKVM